RPRRSLFRRSQLRRDGRTVQHRARRTIGGGKDVILGMTCARVRTITSHYRTLANCLTNADTSLSNFRPRRSVQLQCGMRLASTTLSLGALSELVIGDGGWSHQLRITNHQPPSTNHQAPTTARP